MENENYFEGIVDKFCADGRNFGFITYRHSGRECRVFFHNGSIRPDNIGRTGQAWTEQTLVRFKLEHAIRRGESRLTATDVHPVFAEEPIKCPEAHREVSQVIKFSSSRNSVWLQRQSGEQLFLRLKHVVPQFVPRFQEELRVGDWVFHGVVENVERDPTVWEATEAEIFSREENELRNDPPSVEVEVETEPQVEPEVELEIFKPHLAKLSLLEIIKRQRK